MEKYEKLMDIRSDAIIELCFTSQYTDQFILFIQRIKIVK